MLTQLKPTHYNVFVYLVSFMRELLRHKANELTPDTLGMCTTPLFESNSLLYGCAVL